MTDPDAPSWWGEGEESSADPYRTLFDRLAAALAAAPDSPTLNALAVRDHEGRVIGTTAPTTALGLAWLNGAPTSLLLAAERLQALVGAPGARGRLYRAVRLDWLRRDLNRRLRHYTGRDVLGSVTVRLPLNRPELAAVALPAVLDAPQRAEAAELVVTDADPPPLDSASSAPLLRTGPPAVSVVRPRPAAPVLVARRFDSERWTVSRAA